MRHYLTCFNNNIFNKFYLISIVTVPRGLFYPSNPFYINPFLIIAFLFKFYYFLLIFLKNLYLMPL